MNTTSKYGFPQWEPDDPIRREDFNSFAAKAESALAGLGSSVSSLTAARNARISMKVQRGVSTTEVRYSFPFSPDFVMVLGENGVRFFFARGSMMMYLADYNGAKQYYSVTCGSDYITVSGSDKTAAVPYLADPNTVYFVMGVEQTN